MPNEKNMKDAGTYGEPFNFDGKDYYGPRELAETFCASYENWEYAARRLKNGDLGKWLEANADSGANAKLNEILAASGNDRDLAVLNVITAFAPEIPFSIYGKTIDFETLCSVIKNYVQAPRLATDAEKKIVGLLNEGCRLFDYYKAHFNATGTTPESRLYSILKSIKGSRLKVTKKLDAIIGRITGGDLRIVPERFKGAFSDLCDFMFANHDFLIAPEDYDAIASVFPQLRGVDDYDDYRTISNVLKKCAGQGVRPDAEFFGSIARKYFIPEEVLKNAPSRQLIPFIDYMADIEKNERRLTIENLEYLLKNYYFIPRNIYADLNGDDFDRFMNALEFIDSIILEGAYVKIDDAALFKDASDEWSIDDLRAVKYCIDEKIPARIFKSYVRDLSSKGESLKKLKNALIVQKVRAERSTARKKYFALFIVSAVAACYFGWYNSYYSRYSGGVIIAQNYFGYYGMISDGKWIAGPGYEWIGKIDRESGLAVFRQGRKCGFIDGTGRIVMAPEFDFIGQFGKDGLAEVRHNFKYGYIGRDFKFILTPAYDSVCKLGENAILLELGRKYGLATRQGKVLVQPSYDKIDTGRYGSINFFKITQNGKKGVIDENGTLRIPPEYDDVVRYNGKGLSIVKLGGKLGCVGEDGKPALEPLYDRVDEFGYRKQKTARIWQNGKQGLINKKGEVLVKPLYEYVDDFQNGKTGVMKQNGKYGMIGEHGEVVSAASWDNISIDHRYGVAIIKRNKKYGLMDMTGRVFLEPFYDHIDSFNIFGVAEIELGSKTGRITKNGRVLIEPQ